MTSFSRAVSYTHLAGSYRSDIQRLADNACRSDYDIGWLYSEHGREQVARALGYLNAVRVAGVRVSAVAYDRLRLAVCDMIFCDDQRRALDEVSCCLLYTSRKCRNEVWEGNLCLLLHKH